MIISKTTDYPLSKRECHVSRGRGKMLVCYILIAKVSQVTFDVNNNILNEKDPPQCLRKSQEENCHYVLESGAF